KKVTGDAGDVHIDTVTVVGTDDDNQQVDGKDHASVSVTDVAPSVDLTKSVDPGTLAEPGGDFTFTLKIDRKSVEPVTIDALTDDNTLSQDCLDLVDTPLAVDETVSCD